MTREGEVKYISRSSLWTILLIVFLVVSLGTLGTMEEKAGLFEEGRVSYGHSVSEIDALETLVLILPDKTTINADFEMGGPIRYTKGCAANPSTITKKPLEKAEFNKEDAYIVFKTTLIGEGTTSYIQHGSSELEREWYTYNILPNFMGVMDALNSKTYVNGELCMYDLSSSSGIS